MAGMDKLDGIQLSFLISNLWPMFLSFGLGLIWLIRLEAKVLQLETEHNTVNNKLDSMQNKLIEIGESLARLEGKLEGKN